MDGIRLWTGASCASSLSRPCRGNDETGASGHANQMRHGTGYRVRRFPARPRPFTRSLSFKTWNSCNHTRYVDPKVMRGEKAHELLMLERGRRARPPVPERLLEGESTLSLMMVNLQGLPATIFRPNEFCGGAPRPTAKINSRPRRGGSLSEPAFRLASVPLKSRGRLFREGETMSYGAVSQTAAAPSAQNRGRLRAAVLGVAAACAVALAATANWAHGEGEKVKSPPPPGGGRFGSRAQIFATWAEQPTRIRHRACVLI